MTGDLVNGVIVKPIQNVTRSPARRLNVGVVGIGRMGRRHAMNILRLVPRANLLCACSPAEADLVWADEHLVPYRVQVYPTFEEMIETPGLEAVIIASATELHLKHTTAALDRGIHVLCEKPICTSISELYTLIDKVEANPKTKLMVGFVRRFDENYQDAYHKIKEGKIGTPIVIRSQGCEKLDTSSAYKQYLKGSGGIFLDSIIHDIDLSILLLGGNCKPKSVSAAGVSAIHTELAEDGDADNAVGICEFWDGKIAYFYNSRTAAHGYDNATEIFGTAGKISVNMTPRRNRVELCDGDGLVKVEPTPGWYDRYSAAFVAEAISWVNAILDEEPMPVPLRDCLTSLIIAQALQESLKTGRKVTFDKDTFQPEKGSCMVTP
ncbi:uncharacterized protein Z518_01516 [Rhinocladiella mackenziei CBS 650.93]|uniref:Inositol 2-dehydrogenase n=1 Tax=Rhinocladiella mackenziei CBS 650.93 TaxID=1442369 RepID=A0A0D2IWR2_9EURO|nr:uncharacterized protein Z518_01516 [Rhinocladiella mackenziei CBS 650.93]KIX10434.1 hypothetical protein Z518_01516 [Rhinocladiella mackenziei CBS 650.93]